MGGQGTILIGTDMQSAIITIVNTSSTDDLAGNALGTLRAGDGPRS